MILNDEQQAEVRRSATQLGQFLRMMQHFGVPVKVSKQKVTGGRDGYAIRISGDQPGASKVVDGNTGYAFEMEFAPGISDGARFQRARTGVEGGLFDEYADD